MAEKAAKSNRPKYDLNAAGRRRDLLFKVGLTSVVLIFAVVLIGYIVISHDKKTAATGARAIRVTTSKLVTKDGTHDPKAVVSFYEDFLCPACGRFEQLTGPTVNKLIDIGAIRADYYMVALLDGPGTDHYSSRAAGAAYCVADASIDAFRRFHSMLFSERLQPAETGPDFPDNSRLIETARQAGVVGEVPSCINSGRYLRLVKGMVEDIPPSEDGKVGTPTILVNGERYTPSTPEALVSRIKEIVGDIPGIDTIVPAKTS